MWIVTQLQLPSLLMGGHNVNWTIDILHIADHPIVSQAFVEESTLLPLELQMDVVDLNKNLLNLLLS